MSELNSSTNNDYDLPTVDSITSTKSIPEYSKKFYKSNSELKELEEKCKEKLLIYIIINKFFIFLLSNI